MYSNSTDLNFLTLKVVDSVSSTSSRLPNAFTNKADLREYLDRLAEKKLDEIAQDLATKLEGGFVLQQQPDHHTAYRNYTETIVKPSTYAAYLCIPNQFRFLVTHINVYKKW